MYIDENTSPYGSPAEAKKVKKINKHLGEWGMPPRPLSPERNRGLDN